MACGVLEMERTRVGMRVWGRTAVVLGVVKRPHERRERKRGTPHARMM